MNQAHIRELLPQAGRIVDPLFDIGNEAREGSTDRPWVMTNMVSTIDGGTAIDGVSGGLGGPADRRVFSAIRSVASVIVAGAATVIEEKYRRPRTSAEVVSRRAELGLPAQAGIAIVTSSLSLDTDLPIFEDSEFRPIIITVDDSPRDRREALGERADIIIAGTGRVDLGDAFRQLGEAGNTTILVEGGPSLNGQVVADDLVDEWNLTISPVLASGTSKRAAQGPNPSDPSRLEIARIWQGDDLIFGRWIRDTTKL